MDASARSRRRGPLGLLLPLFLAVTVPGRSGAQEPVIPADGLERSGAGVVAGVVHGRMGGERVPLTHAWIEVVDASRAPSTISGEGGAYALRGVPPGERTLRVSRLGYRALELRVTVPDGGTLHLDVEVEGSPIAVAGVTVRHAPSLERIGDPSQLGGGEVELGILEMGPGGGEAGLASAARALAGGESGSSGQRLLIRGSVADQKRVLLDGVPVHAPFHLGGLLPGIQADLFEEAVHHAGAAPASLAGGLSNVLELTTRSPATDRFRGRASGDMATAALTLEGPLTDRISGLASARTLHGLGARAATDDALPYGYREVILRGGARPTEGQSLDATVFWNRETVRLDLADAGVAEAGTPLPEPDQARWRNGAASLRWRAEVGASSIRAAVGGARYEAVLPLGRNEPVWARGRTGRLRASLEGSTPLDDWTAGWGVQAEKLEHRSSARFLDGEEGGAVAQAAGGRVVGGHLEGRRSFGSALSVRAGLRADRFSRDDAPLRLSPRVRASWHLGSDAVLAVGAGKHFQFVQPADLEVQMALGDPAATRAGQALYPVAGATHMVVSLEQWMSPEVFLGVDGYVKAFDGLPGIEGGVLRSSGVDLRVRRRGEASDAWLGYSLAWFWRPDGSASGGAGADAFTGRHLLSAGLRGRLGEVVGGELRLAYGDGLPFTSVPILGDATAPAREDASSGGGTLDSASDRDPVAPTLDGFLRVDLELDAEWETRMGGRPATLRPYLRVLNALERRDALFFYFEPWRSPEARPLARRPLLPLVGIEVRF